MQGLHRRQELQASTQGLMHSQPGLAHQTTILHNAPCLHVQSSAGSVSGASAKHLRGSLEGWTLVARTCASAERRSCSSRASRAAAHSGSRTRCGLLPSLCCTSHKKNL